MNARLLDPLDDYGAINAVNWSTLKHILRSPLHYRHILETGFSPTPAMQFGTAVHLAVLEPEQFRARYVVAPDFGDMRSSKNRAARDEWIEERPGVQTLTLAECERILATAGAVLAHGPARELLSGADVEQGIEWVDAATGVTCKGRLDAVGPLYVVDLKTAVSVEPWAFQQRSAKLLYHAQLAFYVDGYKAATGQDRGAAFIAVESADPHDVAVFELGDDALAVGRDVYHQALVQLVECEKSGSWPGVARGQMVPFYLPKWAQLDDDDLADLGLE